MKVEYLKKICDLYFERRNQEDLPFDVSISGSFNLFSRERSHTLEAILNFGTIVHTFMSALRERIQEKQNDYFFEEGSTLQKIFDMYLKHKTDFQQATFDLSPEMSVCEAFGDMLAIETQEQSLKRSQNKFVRFLCRLQDSTKPAESGPPQEDMMMLLERRFSTHTSAVMQQHTGG